MLVTTKEMFEKSMKEHYAIGAFNINNMEFIQAITEAANEVKSPVILQVSSSAIKYARINYLIKMVEAATEETNIPIALHLDHGPDFETCKMCVDAGFTSVMIDGSKYDFEENIALTKKVVDLALMTDLYKATATINGISKTLQYNTKFDSDMNAIIDVMQGKTADNVEYNINLYRSDYNYRIGKYVNGPSIAHQPTLSGDEQTALQESREELEVILEYVIVLANQSTTNASVEEFEFYFDLYK